MAIPLIIQVVAALAGAYYTKKQIDKATAVASQPIPAPAPPPPPSSVSAAEPLKNVTEESRMARDTTRRRAAALAGMGGTQKTGGLGVPGPAMGFGKSLLGQ